MTIKKETITIFIIFVLCSLMGFSTCLAAPLGNIWQNFLGIKSNSFGMFGNLLCFLPYFLFGYLAGNILEKLGYKKTIIIAFLLGFLGITIQYLSCKNFFLKFYFSEKLPLSIFIYFLGAFISGTSNCFINTLYNPLINHLLGEGNKANSLNILVCGVNSFSGSIAFFLLGFFRYKNILNLSSISKMLLLVVFIFLITMIIAFFSPIKKIEKSNSNESSLNLKKILSIRHFYLGMIAIFLYMGIEIGLNNYTRIALNSMNFYHISSFLSGIFIIFMSIGRLIGFFVGQKVSSQILSLFSSFICIFLCFLGIFVYKFYNNLTISVFQYKIPLFAIFFVCCGFFISIFSSSLFNLSLKGLKSSAEKMSGLFMTMLFGGGLIPIFQSFIFDNFGVIATYFISIFSFLYLFLYSKFYEKL